MRGTWIVTICLALLSAAAGAGELHLRNGARIPGELRSVDGRNIVWRAELIGDIKVETKSIASVDSITAARFSRLLRLRQAIERPAPGS